MFLAICTPSDPGAEFILTDNSYGIFEGPNTFCQNKETGKVEESGWTSFHEFAPLSPKLMIILRSFLLPNPEEDGSQRIREVRESWRKMAVDDFYMAEQKSMLADLPITKPRNSYSQVVNGRVQLLPGEDGKPRKTDKFCFRFFPVSTEHVNKINLFLFDNAQRCNNIVFGTEDAFKRTLEWYMTTPVTYGKVVTADAPELKRKHLEKLAALMKALGSTKQPVWTEVPLQRMPWFGRIHRLMKDSMRMFPDVVGTSNKETPSTTDGLMRSYRCLGGSKETIVKDLEQAQRMLTLRIKIDVWSKGIPEYIRAQAREWLIKSYLEGCPPRRVLHYLKRVRLMVLYHDKEGHLSKATEVDHWKIEGAEDVVAEAAHSLTTRTGLNWLMYRTFTNDIEKVKNPDFDPWAKVPRGMEEAMHLGMAGKFVLDVPGKLKKCGIAEIEELARTQEQIILDQGLYRRKEFDNDFFEDDEKIEVLTRVMVRPQCQKALRGRMEDGLMGKFEKVMFEVTYPTPPIRPGI
ncbi:hypothetical protein F4818DRAFT_423952 [Hypoxylon cercidicola]|nr:hypothetical protein F4818DRAFT_423952 [Hypoxylon cercidicola]